MNYALIVTNLAGGGAERAMLNLAALLTERGHHIDLILLENIVEHSVPNGIALHVVTPVGRTGHGWLGKRLTALRLARLWRGINRRRTLDLSISTLPYCDEVVRLARLPRVRYRVANTLSAEIDRLARLTPTKAQRRRTRYRNLYDRQRLIAVSSGVAADLRERLDIDANIAVVYNPFDFERIRGLSAEPEPDLPARPYVIHVGRFSPQKRHDLLLDAWKLVGLDMPLILLCEPDGGLERMIAERGLTERVTVAGFHANPFPWIARAELLVLCSDHEGMPNVLVEALACGTRVVSTDCPSGPREVLTGDLARWLVPMSDPLALAATMRDALQAPPPCITHELDAFEASTVVGLYESLAKKEH
ncbi:glycosyltransferase [Acidihalobacter ferrooxydans]|uniref:Glycosyltransferase subfamily 4-like N-terminal domain-containing protein n=1 Tax=Acidihalobacter ferrooxydans TaxID=1765967 RepID=A0A1P8UJ16_9GAMM|nr:glycosyltransferase [Acidihalobacter ferrooxydans]APZ43812.1 hypothetical protein BW247_12535 [Acidihalobacter ferrooxydans]